VPGGRLATLLLQNSTRLPLSRLVSSFTAHPIIGIGHRISTHQTQHEAEIILKCLCTGISNRLVRSTVADPSPDGFVRIRNFHHGS
jgi:hypothetical protein